jgi:hypothetical protein
VEKRLQAESRGEGLTAKQIHGQVQKIAGRDVSLGYDNRLPGRHGWRKLGPQPQHPKAQPHTQEEFKNSLNSSKRR